MGQAVLGVEQQVIELIARELKMCAGQISLEMPLIEMGIDSMSAMIIAGELEQMWSIKLPETLLWDCETPRVLIAQVEAARQGFLSVAGRAGELS